MTDFSGEGFLNITPSEKQTDIVYPTPQDPMPPDIPAHFRKNSQAIANNMNHVYDFLHKLSGIDPSDPNDSDGSPIPVIEKVNVPQKADSTADYGQARQGLASKGPEANETQWLNFVEEGDFDTVVNERVPVGTIVIWYAKNGSFNTNWVLCDGTSYILSDGSTLHTPDLQGRYPIGNSNNKTSVVNNNKNEPRINGVTDNLVFGMDNFNWISNSTTTYKHACDREVKSITETYGYNAPTSKLAPAIWGGGTHNHYISSQKKKVGGGTGKTVWVISGTIQANSNYYYAHGHAQDGHSHTFNHIHHMKGGAASKTKNNYMRPPSVGVHFIMYAGNPNDRTVKT